MALVRCAVYTRKSSEEGLEQSYNSLDAQRDACAAYVLSQAGEGWVLLQRAYDDGGVSGGTMERPALQRLLADIQARLVDVVIVYKVDRLTRSLADFARIVEILDQNSASFVSVTQAFNTTTSMGRLTLNVLLSFAQFEREVTGERIRDKIAASKKLGMWMGGPLPLGYDLPAPGTRALVVNPVEAEQVRDIFQRYLELGSVHRLRDGLAADGIVSKRHVTRAGRETGGGPFARGALYHLLRNPLYVGEISHKGVTYPGQHTAIIPRELFAAVQRLLTAADTPITGSSSVTETAMASAPHAELLRHPTFSHVTAQRQVPPLIGLLYDGDGAKMTPVSARKRGGAVYRYYVSQSLLTGHAAPTSNSRRVNAALLERQVYGLLSAAGLVPGEGGKPDWAAAGLLLQRVALNGNRLALTLVAAPQALAIATDEAALRARLGEDVAVQADEGTVTMTSRLTLTRRSGTIGAFGPAGHEAVIRIDRDAALTSALIRAESWKRRLFAGEIANVEAIAKEEGVTAAYITRLIRLTFLAPALKRQILDGRQPVGLTMQRLKTNDVPLAWSEQQALYRS
jgi:site-specific DNA recombinase